MKWNALLLVGLVFGTGTMRAQEPEATAGKPEAAAQETDKPLPPVQQLLEDVERNERAGEAIRNDYTYHVRFDEVDLDGSGKVKKTTVRESESLTIDGVRVNRLVMLNGKPLTDEEKQKENERIDKDVAKAKERRAKLEGKGKETTSTGQELMPASRFLELGTFSNPRREMLNGRAAIVMDYAGDPQAKTKSEFEGIVRDLVGTIWVDEADHVMVQAEGHFLKDFKVGAGLVADIHKGLKFRVVQQKVNDEVWLPAETEGEGSARILLFVKIDGSVKVDISDYRKFRTGATIVPSYRVIGPDGLPVPDATNPAAPAPATSPKP